MPISRLAAAQEASAPGEILVKLRAGASAPVVHARAGGRVLRVYAATGWQRVQAPAGLSLSAVLARYRAQPEVAAAEPNYRVHATALPNDPSMSQLWGMAKIQAPAAWDITTGSTNVVVAIIDSGINDRHTDLRANLWRNPGEIAGNGIDDDGNGYIDDIHGIDAIANTGDPRDENGHGTHVAGTIGAAGNNGIGVAGVNWTARLMALKFIGADDNGYISDAIECYAYATAMKKRGVNVRVINASWGGSGYSQALKDAIDAAANAGILSVVAAGNDGKNLDVVPDYPASYDSPGILTVAASDRNDAPASFTDYGAQTVDIAAPGVGIFSTYATSPTAYATADGTSMATPHVAGAAALLLARNPALSVAAIKSALMSTVDRTAAWAGRIASGGRLNIARALQSLGGVTPPSPTTRITAVRLSVSPSSPRTVNTPVTLTAIATGGQAEYRFVVAAGTPLGWHATELQPYSANPVATWQPATAGSYLLTVYARAQGSTAKYEVMSTTAFSITGADGRPPRQSLPLPTMIRH